LDLSDLTPIQIPFEYEGKPYVLHEASGAVARKFNNERSNRVEYGPEGKVTRTRDMADIVPMLVAGCVKTAGGSNVPQTVIESWNDRTVKKLYDKARKISFMEGVATEHQLAKLVDEPGFPCDKKAFVDFVHSLPADKYSDLQTEFRRPPLKE
jgi:hypothetical protein